MQPFKEIVNQIKDTVEAVKNAAAPVVGKHGSSRPVLYSRREDSHFIQRRYKQRPAGNFVRVALLGVPGNNRREKKAYLRLQRKQRTANDRKGATFINTRSGSEFIFSGIVNNANKIKSMRDHEAHQ